MAIFTNWGDDVKIVGGSFTNSIRVIRESDGQKMTLDLTDLYADCGQKEINEALRDAKIKSNEILKYIQRNRGNKEAQKMTDKQSKEAGK